MFKIISLKKSYSDHGSLTNLFLYYKEHKPYVWCHSPVFSHLTMGIMQQDLIQLLEPVMLQSKYSPRFIKNCFPL